MKRTKQIDKARLMFFTDALLAIIMTVLVLDIKVPDVNPDDGRHLFNQLFLILPHLFGFIISFAFIVVLWFSHHDLMESLLHANRTLAALNFCFVAATATLPFSTSLAASYSNQSVAVATLAINMFVMNIFLAGSHIYSAKSGLRDMNFFPQRYLKIKQMLGVSSGLIFLFSIFISFISPFIALIIIATVPILHIIPIAKR